MRAEVVYNLWSDYKGREINKQIHPNDHMFNTSATGWHDYGGIGENAVQIITSALLAGPSYHLLRVLDFGCGHGRVARHLRAFLPNAEIFFCDEDMTGSKFCAEQFNGTVVPTQHDFSKLELPGDIDLIWVGSVFTHLDYGRMNSLFAALVSALRERGTLVATFRGEFMYRRDIQETDPVQKAKWASMLAQYEAGGIGFKSYGHPDFPDWGLSLSSIERVVGMGRRFKDIRLVNYSEAGWASAHDVAAWSRNPKEIG